MVYCRLEAMSAYISNAVALVEAQEIQYEQC